MGKRELTRNEQVVLIEASILAGMDWFESRESRFRLKQGFGL